MATTEASPETATSDSAAASLPTLREAEQRVQAALQQLRRAIRRYVWWLGLSLATVWLLGTFWLAVGIDYLPVALGLTDLPPLPRAVVLALILGGLLTLLYRELLRRLLVPLHDRSLALLLERRFPQLDESLATAVQYRVNSSGVMSPAAADTAGAVEAHPELLESATRLAGARVRGLAIDRVLNKRSARRWTFAGGLLACSLVAFALLAPDRFALALQRSYLLAETPWPRFTKLTAAGLVVAPPYDFPNLDEQLYRPVFRDGSLQVAAGASFDVWVRAQAPDEAHPDRRVPRACVVRYLNQAGERGTVSLSAEGSLIRGEQTYRYSGAPFEAVLDSFRLDFRGGDDRLARYRVEVVEPPTLLAAELDCVFPNYMVDLASGSWTERAIPLPLSAPLPFGTTAVFRAKANKPLARVFIHHITTDKTWTLELEAEGEAPREFSFPLARLLETGQLELALLDTAGVLSTAKFTFDLPVTRDQPPRVQTELVGIGTAITPQAVIPLQGTVTDDYAAASAWVEISGTQFDLVLQDLSLQAGNRFRHQVDFLELARDSQNPLQLKAGPEAAVTLTTKAIDRFNLESDGTPASENQNTSGASRGRGAVGQTGTDTSLQLQVVTPTELLRLLERVEVGLRQRLEQTRDEMQQAQVQVLQARLSLDDNAAAGTTEAAQPANSDELGDDIEEVLSDLELKVVYARRALLQSNKSRGELEGVAAAFDDIRLQLINNRVRAIDREDRLANQVAAPLRQLTSTRFPAIAEKLERLESQLLELRDTELDAAAEEHPANSSNFQAAVLEANLLADDIVNDLQVILNELDEVLAKLIKYESYSELLDLVRDIIREQEALREETEKQRKQQGLRDLFDQ